MNRLVIICISVPFSTGAHAAPIIDVNNLVTGQAYAGVGASSIFDATNNVLSNRIVAQAWTVNQTGLLAGIDLFGSASTNSGANGYLKFYSGGTENSPGTNLLGSLTFALASIPFLSVQSIDLSSLGIHVTSGQTMTFEMSIDPCQSQGSLCLQSWTSWTMFKNNGAIYGSYNYAGGKLYLNSAEFNNDLNFRTYVDPAFTPSVPEPATWAMLIGGMTFVGASMRRRKTAVSFA